nr:response regulator transcription factor [Sedimentibacter sp.]
MKKVLLVEDDKTIVLGLEYFLKQEGYDVIVCNDMKTALKIVKTHKYDIAILDISLPDGNGYDICKEIRRNGDTPVIFLTACDEEVNVIMGFDMGADDYVTKPFRVRELLSRIKTILNRVGKREKNKNEIEIGNIIINTATGKVIKNNEEIFLTALEYRLLLTLANNEGQILTRNQLLEGIWDIDGNFVNDNTLTVYIKRLRDKIEDDSQNPKIINTVRGMGYRIGG